MRSHTIPLSVRVDEKENYYIRIYPWSEKQTTQSYLCLYKLCFTGVLCTPE
ncbi:MAG: hypothetical protein LUD15_05600 [Bacteroides sp.]|nr:hypothetical protein [Bacteroides sp.]